MSRNDPLKVIEAAREFGLQVLQALAQLPRTAPSGLRSQLAESAQAVASLLAEGFGRGTTAEKIHYSRMANGSLEESQEHLRECINLHLIERKVFYRLWNLSVVTSHMLLSLLETLEARLESE
jgi:four helix bundle protein